jgi:EpsI family protein
MHRLSGYAPAMLLVVGCGLVGSAKRQRSVSLSRPLQTLLTPLPGYTVVDQQVGAEERRVAGMTDYIARIYEVDGTVAFTTYVGYYDHQAQGRSIHSPRNCLPGAGWEVLHGGTATIVAADGPHVVNRYLMKKDAAEAVVYYWYQGRGRLVANEYAVKLNLLRDAVLEGHTEEALVRIVVPLVPSRSTDAAADRLALTVAPRLMDELRRGLPPSSARAATGGNDAS